jgi:hypothetical protein
LRSTVQKDNTICQKETCVDAKAKADCTSRPHPACRLEMENRKIVLAR